MLHIVGECDKRIFGLPPSERLQRQLHMREEISLVAHASAVLDDAALDWLVDNQGTLIASASGRPLAAVSGPDEVKAAVASIESGRASLPVTVATGEQFVRKLRRRVPLFACSLLDGRLATVEKRLFSNVYKGVTDLVTKWVWPWPAFHLTRLFSRLGITPNMVTLTGVGLVFLAAWLFYRGDLALALLAAWLMCLFDTIDGKLARVTVTSSKLGDKLDHGTDIIHPPIWWYCLAHGVTITHPANSDGVWTAFWIILGCYVAGRAIELGFKSKFGINPFIWRPFDSWFRLIVSRRNIILLIMTVGLLLQATWAAFWACAAWSLISLIIQAIRLAQAVAEAGKRPIQSWLS